MSDIIDATVTIGPALRDAITFLLLLLVVAPPLAFLLVAAIDPKYRRDRGCK